MMIYHRRYVTCIVSGFKRICQECSEASNMAEFKQKSSRCGIWAAIFMCLVFLGGGIAIGYFAIPRQKEKEPQLPDYQERCTSQCASQAQQAASCSAPLPRHYTAYYLHGKNITVDGKLEEEAWQEVPYTENFVDIRGGSKYGTPPVKTMVKVRYDDEAVYVGAYLEEPQVWATYTEKDSRIYEENAFEIFFDVDNSMSMYKEIEINALGTTWDLMLSRAYMDGGSFFDWEGIREKGVFTDGEVNNPSVKATYWSTEMVFPFANLNENTTRRNIKPRDGEMWFTIFARPRYQLEVVGNTYRKKAGTDASWYSWAPTGAVNLHLPSKWGLLFFDESTPSTTAPSVTSKRWLTYQGLFDIFNAMKAAAAQRGPYTNDEEILNLPPYITSGSCFVSYRIELVGGGFFASLESKSETDIVGNIDQNRHVTFTIME